MKNIAILGPRKTFSDAACSVIESVTRQTFDRRYYPTIEAAMEAVRQDGLGILPIENTLEGYVQQHMDLLLEHRLRIIGEVELPIAFSAVSHVPIESIGTMYVQYAAQHQCRRFIQSLASARIRVTDSNMASCESFLGDPLSAAIIPQHVYAETPYPYGLAEVTDDPANATRFLMVAPYDLEGLPIDPARNVKITVAVLPILDRPGLLYGILGVFAAHGINLLSIMSRPDRRHPGRYHFHIDLEARPENVEFVRSVLEQMNTEYDVRMFGIYQKLQEATR